MIRLLILASMFLSSLATAAPANLVGVEVGFRSQSGDATATGASSTSKTGFSVGGLGEFGGKGSEWKLRTGLFYTQRPLTVESGGTSVDLSMTYFDLPIQALYRFEDHAGVFAGPVIAMLLEKKASAGSITGANGMLIPIQLGGTIRFMPDIGITLFYEMASGKIADGVENYRAVGANLVFSFE
jgi:hypothetical protein